MEGRAKVVKMAKTRLFSRIHILFEFVMEKRPESKKYVDFVLLCPRFYDYLISIRTVLIAKLFAPFLPAARFGPSRAFNNDTHKNA